VDEAKGLRGFGGIKDGRLRMENEGSLTRFYCLNAQSNDDALLPQFL